MPTHIYTCNISTQTRESEATLDVDLRKARQEIETARAEAHAQKLANLKALQQVSAVPV